MNQSSPEDGRDSRKLGERMRDWWLSDADQQPATLQGPHGRVTVSYTHLTLPTTPYV